MRKREAIWGALYREKCVFKASIAIALIFRECLKAFHGPVSDTSSAKDVAACQTLSDVCSDSLSCWTRKPDLNQFRDLAFTCHHE